MDFNKPPTKLNGTQSIDSPEQKKVPVYLDFTDEEKAEVISKIIEQYSSQGRDIKNKQIDFPIKQEEIESLVNGQAQHFKTKRLLEVALNNLEFAPNLTKELTRRKDLPSLIKILQHYKGTLMFEYCVREIEANLQNDETQNSVLMALSEAVAETKDDERVPFEIFSRHMLNKPEKAARNLATYLKFLGIKDENIKRLLDKKKLLLIGGGTAPIKSELKERGIDCNVTNIEPLLIEKNQENSDRAIPKNFYDVDVKDMGNYDEIWSANNSLPTYAFNPEQVKTFYQKALSAVKPGGYLRILPVSGFTDAITPAMRINRIPTNNESIRIIEILKQRPDLFQIEEFKTPTLKSFFGEKRRMKGVNIKFIADKKKIDIFLKELIDKN